MPYTINPFTGLPDYYQSAGSTTVFGPGSSTDKALVRWNGITGTLVQNGITIETDTGEILAGNGSVTNPAFSFVGEPGTGWYWIGAGHIGYASGGGTPVDISSSAFVANVEVRTFGGLNAAGYILVNVNTPVAAATINVGSSDYFMGITSSIATQVNLPANPATGRTIDIKDISGQANANNITVSGNGKNIDGAATSVINIAYGSLTVKYNGTTWSIT